MTALLLLDQLSGRHITQVEEPIGHDGRRCAMQQQWAYFE